MLSTSQCHNCVETNCRGRSSSRGGNGFGRRERRAEKTLQLGGRVFAEVVKSIRTRSRITRISRESLFSGTLRDGFSSWRFFLWSKWQRVRRAISSTLFFSCSSRPKIRLTNTGLGFFLNNKRLISAIKQRFQPQNWWCHKELISSFGDLFSVSHALWPRRKTAVFGIHRAPKRCVTVMDSCWLQNTTLP